MHRPTNTRLDAQNYLAGETGDVGRQQRIQNTGAVFLAADDDGRCKVAQQPADAVPITAAPHSARGFETEFQQL